MPLHFRALPLAGGYALLALALAGTLASPPAEAADPARKAAAQTATATVSLPSGGIYHGPLRRGKLHGQGRIDWDRQTWYEGGFVNGFMQGHGVYSAPAYRYEGQFKRGHPSGHGTLTQGTDVVYEGEMAMGLMQGQGKARYADGAYTFEGQFAANKPAGRGRLTDAAGTSIEGVFEGFEVASPAVITWRGGARYEGEIKNRVPHGQGQLTRPDKAVVRARFEDGEVEGDGTITLADGAVYTGPIFGARAYGKGTLKRANGDVYQGDFVADEFQGQGILTLADGQVLAGTWRAGALVRPGSGTADDTPQTAARNNETALYNQSALLQTQFDQLLPGTPGTPRLYALLVAGDGRQEVFRREVGYVDKLLAERLGTRGRSISLVNSRTSIGTLPLATAHSIGLALRALADKMDREHDLLFVFLTSHGSPSHELSLSQSGMALPGLPAAQLGALLKASGIRNQVVVVSACYSGGFVPALQGERTWVITAARADRTSFGCDDDNDFTYFGRALFQDGMAQSTTLSGAFEQARQLVDEWETRDARKAAAKATAPLPSGASADTAAPPSSAPAVSERQRSEPISAVSPAFQADVDAFWRAHWASTAP